MPRERPAYSKIALVFRTAFTTVLLAGVWSGSRAALVLVLLLMTGAIEMLSYFEWRRSR